MRFLTTAAMTLALACAAAAAHAQPPPNDQHDQQHGGQQHGGQGGGAQQHGQGQGQGQHAGGPAQGGPQSRRGPVQGPGGGQPGQGNAQAPRLNGPGGANASLGFQNHAPRARDAGRVAYSASTVARTYQAQRQVRFAGYSVYPSGWAYRAWSYGQFLPPGWFASQYYLDWAAYGLPPPPIGCEWIAEGPDAVLVDIWTGEVLSVYHGVFYWNAY